MEIQHALLSGSTGSAKPHSLAALTVHTKISTRHHGLTQRSECGVYTLARVRLVLSRSRGETAALSMRDHRSRSKRFSCRKMLHPQNHAYPQNVAGTSRRNQAGDSQDGAVHVLRRCFAGYSPHDDSLNGATPSKARSWFPKYKNGAIASTGGPASA